MPTTHCSFLAYGLIVATAFAMCSAAALFYIRVLAIHRGTRWFAALLGLLWIALLATIILAAFFFSIEHVAHTHYCLVFASSWIGFPIPVAILALYDTTCFILLSGRSDGLHMNHLDACLHGPLFCPLAKEIICRSSRDLFCDRLKYISCEWIVSLIISEKSLL